MINKNIWQHKSRVKTEKLIEDLKSRIKKSDIKNITKIFQDPRNLRSLVIARGEQSANYRLLLKGFDLIVAKYLDNALGFMVADNDAVLRMLHQREIPEQVIGEINDIAYHLRDKEMFDKSANLILEATEPINNKQLIVRMIHNQGTWSGSVDNNPALAVELNKSVLGQTRELEDRALEQKIKFGIKIYKIKSNNKAIRLGDLAKDFEQIAQIFEQEKVEYDTAYSWLEAARAYFALSTRQSRDKGREDECKNNLAKAKELALKAVARAHELGYSNLEIVSQELISRISIFLNENRSARKYKEKADNARILYDYQTKLDHLKD